MKEGDSIAEVIKEITSEQILLYAEASGDFNPIHI
ncbi:acyl dehydratase, partial [SAR202 cluster bacterium AD-802-K11_MRT_200m]|nr:acyl dehydratase [SAR202 cluster bacterium AD-802-K11_MRT_200m]